RTAATVAGARPAARRLRCASQPQLPPPPERAAALGDRLESRAESGRDQGVARMAARPPGRFGRGPRGAGQPSAGRGLLVLRRWHLDQLPDPLLRRPAAAAADVRDQLAGLPSRLPAV